MSNHDHSFANPGPAGITVLAFYLGALWPIATGMAPHELSLLLVPLGLAGGLVQMTAGIIELRNGMILPGNILLAFSAFMWYGFGANLLKGLGLLEHNTGAVDGWVFLIMGVLMVALTLPFLYKSFAAGFFMITTDIFFFGAALYWLTGVKVFWKIAGWDLPFVVIFVLWQVIADILNGSLGRTVISQGPPLLKKKVTVEQMASSH